MKEFLYVTWMELVARMASVDAADLAMQIYLGFILL